MKSLLSRSPPGALFDLTADDLMSSPLAAIPHDMLLRDAGHLLLASDVSGAPVVDAEGNCIGILSASDFVRSMERGGESPEVGAELSFIAPWGEVVNLCGCSDCTAASYMTRELVSVPLEMPIGSIAQMMVDAHIHRVVVTDGNRPCGIVTSTDIVAAVANAARALRYSAGAKAE